MKGGVIIPKDKFKEFAEFQKKKGESKCVFFLGAGFSADAGIPTQKHLLPEYLKRGGDVLIFDFLSDIYSFDYPPNADRDIYPKLEEIFSTIDTAIMNDEYLKAYNPDKLKKVRKNLLFGILNLINTSKVKSGYIDSFAKVLTEHRLNFGNNDPFAIITTNWDIVLLNAFRRYHNQVIERLCSSRGIKSLNGLEDIKDRGKIALIDYCLYTHPLNGKENHIPSLKIKAMGFKNIKLLYLHGSPTWLYCKRCKKIFSPPSYGGIPTKIILDETKVCPKCPTSPISPTTLSHVLIMPTYYKIIQNVHLLDVWQNAAMELQEATSIFFIGYSLPESDYLIRNLLVSNLNKDANIYVSGRSESDSDTKKNGLDTADNYRQIFGDRIKKVDTDTGKDVIEGICRRIEEKTFEGF